MKKLTPKQKKFCKTYLVNGFNATQAAISAGFSEKSADKIGSQVLGKTRVKEFLHKRMAEIEEKLDMTAEWKLEKLKKCIELSMPEINGETVLENHNAFLGAITESNKMQGHYAPQKTESKLDDEQFKQLLKECEKDY